METKTQVRTDKEIIESLGGPTKVAELLQYDKRKGGAQRVQNWITRGIPARVKLDHLSIFGDQAPSDETS